MSTHQHAVSMPASDVSFTPVANGLLQPKCECDKTPEVGKHPSSEIIQ